MRAAALHLHTQWTHLIDPVRPLLELGGVLLTAALHLGWPLTGLPRGVLVVPLVAAWVGYVAVRAHVAPAALDDWGLRREGLVPTALASLGVLGVGAAGMLAAGSYFGHTLPWWAVACLLVYPIWGLIQQLLVQGMVTRNLAQLPGRSGHPVAVTVVSAAAFGLVHWGEPVLVGSTFLLGLLLAPMWLRWRNLWPMAFVHGWLGTLVYYLVMGRDPLLTYFSSGG